jgi:hypothetical protein
MADAADIRSLVSQLHDALQRSSSFQALPQEKRDELMRDVAAIQHALGNGTSDPYALALDMPPGFNRGFPHSPGGPPDAGTAPAPTPAPAATPGPKAAATQTLAARTGALVDEIDFPSFVAGLVHGTFDAVVDASIRQMEEFANLVSAVAKDIDQFTEDNVTANQARDWLVQQHPGDLQLDLPKQGENREPSVRVRGAGGEEEEPPSPSWLSDFGLGGEQLTDDLVEERLVPAARQRVGENRLQTLATMVLLGMNRINVRDGKVAAHVQFRAAATDKTHVDYATSNDPAGGDSGWGTRGSATYTDHQTLVSTVGVNAQADTDLKAELYGSVEINFYSETLPLDRFADSARLSLVQRNSHSRQTAPQQQLPPAPQQQPAPTPAQQPAPAAQPAPVPTPAPAPGARA